MHALLALLREIEEAERPMPSRNLQIVHNVLSRARMHLTILAPEIGDQELIKSVAAELAKLRCLGEA